MNQIDNFYNRFFFLFGKKDVIKWIVDFFEKKKARKNPDIQETEAEKVTETMETEDFKDNRDK